MLSHDQLMQQMHVGNSSITLYTYLAYAWTKVQQSNKQNRNMDVLKHNQASDSKSQHKDSHLSGIFLDHNATNM